MDTTIDRAVEGGYRYAAVQTDNNTVAIRVRWLDTGAWFTVSRIMFEDWNDAQDAGICLRKLVQIALH